MLDDMNVIAQRDSHNALGVAAEQWTQAAFDAVVEQPEHDGREIKQVVVAGMGGSALAALLAKNWLESSLGISIEVVRTYTLPAYVGRDTLVICSSYSGNTEETVSCLHDALERDAQTAVISAGGELKKQAEARDMVNVSLPAGLQPRMAMLYNLRALIKLFVHFSIVDNNTYNEIASAADWLKQETSAWAKDVTTDNNIAKQIALLSAGKTPIFYAGHLMASVAYKWKISWNENAKNVSFYNELPEFNHNEFMGWASHPIEKPFAVFDIVSDKEHERILKRFEVSDRLLSGRRPKSNTVNLAGDSALKQMLWGCILADFASIYTAILNGVDPTPVDLIVKFKHELG